MLLRHGIQQDHWESTQLLDLRRLITLPHIRSTSFPNWRFTVLHFRKSAFALTGYLLTIHRLLLQVIHTLMQYLEIVQFFGCVCRNRILEIPQSPTLVHLAAVLMERAHMQVLSLRAHQFRPLVRFQAQQRRVQQVIFLMEHQELSAFHIHQR